MFARILSTYRLSRAAVTVQGLLEMHGGGSEVARDAASIANKLVAGAYSENPALFDGKRGRRPHRFSLAAAALARGVLGMKNDRECQRHFHLSLGTILLEITGNPQNYALSGNDHFILDMAQGVYLDSAP